MFEIILISIQHFLKEKISLKGNPAIYPLTVCHSHGELVREALFCTIYIYSFCCDETDFLSDHFYYVYRFLIRGCPYLHCHERISGAAFIAMLKILKTSPSAINVKCLYGVCKSPSRNLVSHF